MVRARVIENRVLPVRRHLNEGVPRRRAFVDAQVRDVGSFGREEVGERRSVGAHRAAVANAEPRTEHRDRLVQALPAPVHRTVSGLERLARAQKMRHLVDVVEIERTDGVDLRHGESRQRGRPFYRSSKKIEDGSSVHVEEEKFRDTRYCAASVPDTREVCVGFRRIGRFG